MKVCDRCKKELDTDKETQLAGRKFELCLTCADYLSRHIETFKPKKSFFG